MRTAVSKENVKLLREMYGRRTLEEFGESLHPDAEQRAPDSLPDTGDYYGREEFLRGLRLWLEEWEMANNVFYEYYKATHNGGNGATLAAWSPATNQYYNVSCQTGAGITKCAVSGTTDPNAEVDLTQAAINAYTPQQANSYAQKAQLGPNG
jgi:hypothetical protein